MSKGLEALEKIKQRLIDICDYIQSINRTAFVECNNDIERYVNVNYNLPELEKELKALEIIKEKRVNLDLLYECFEYNDWEHYSNFQPNFWTPITQEEYNLLKEVLL